MNLAFKYLHENEEDFKRVRRLQQYFTDSIKTVQKRDIALVLEALVTLLIMIRGFIYDYEHGR